MRGKVVALVGALPEIRITPACAGKRISPGLFKCVHLDHPRLCGEKNAVIGVPTHTIGSPPPVRGKEKYQVRKAINDGTTPACAGKSAERLQVLAAEEDHPRVCGEKVAHNGYLPGESGSPPRVRGKGFYRSVWTTEDRITPACAGKRHQLRHQVHWTKDHPRVCGEKLMRQFYTEVRYGSPPRMRGKERQQRTRRQHTGITPACAGKSAFQKSIPRYG